MSANQKINNIPFIFFCVDEVFCYFSDYLHSLNRILDCSFILYNKKNINSLLKQTINSKGILFFIQYLHPYINKSLLKNKKYFVINTEQYTNIQNNNFNGNDFLVDYSRENIKYAQKYLPFREYFFFPYVRNDKEVHNYEKIYDICIVGHMNDRRIKIINQLHKIGINVTVIDDKFGKERDEYLMKHKILLNLHNGKNYQIYESMRCDRCLFNKMIIISEKSLYCKKHWLKKFIVFRKYKNIVSMIKKIMENYDFYYKCIFEKSKFESSITNYDKKIYDIYEKFSQKMEEEIKIKLINKFHIKSLPKIVGKNMPNKTWGFIIVRHVIDRVTNQYWQECYKCIRKIYSNQIIIIDDNSNSQYVNTDLKLINCNIIYGEYPKRGEILGYYYFYKLRPFDRGIIIHDSVFIKKYIDFEKYKSTIFLWSFDHKYDDPATIKIIKNFKNNKKLAGLFSDKEKWKGCYGVMSMISWDIIDKINHEYDFFNIILKNVKSRNERMMTERIFACVCYLCDNMEDQISVLGDINQYCEWGVTWEDYIGQNLNSLSVVKIWTGR